MIIANFILGLAPRKGTSPKPQRLSQAARTLEDGCGRAINIRRKAPTVVTPKRFPRNPYELQAAMDNILERGLAAEYDWSDSQFERIILIHPHQT